MISPNNVSIIGLGKLGASMAGALASRGFNVVGVDINQTTVATMNEGRSPVQEPTLASLIEAHKVGIRCTTDHDDAVQNTDVSFVIVPTPSDARGAFSLRYAAHALRELGAAIRKKDGYHLVVMTSTVLPGSTRYGLLPVLEAASGKKSGRDFGLCYSPEFVALGTVVRDFLYPDFNLIGEHDERAGDVLEECYGRIVLNGAPAVRMSLENAELTKVALNTYVTTKITFANMLGELCDRIPGGDVDVVTNALGLDSRVGRKYLVGALGYGGPCFPRDNVALSFFARSIGVQAELADATDRTNRTLSDRVVTRLVEQIPPRSTVLVLGLGYKPGSEVTEESQGIGLAKAFARAGLRVLAFDPIANDVSRIDLRYDAIVMDSLPDALRQADVVVVTTPDPVYQFIDVHDLRAGAMVIDFWRTLSHLQNQPDVDYIEFGRPSASSTAATETILKELWTQA